MNHYYYLIKKDQLNRLYITFFIQLFKTSCPKAGGWDTQLTLQKITTCISKLKRTQAETFGVSLTFEFNRQDMRASFAYNKK